VPSPVSQMPSVLLGMLTLGRRFPKGMLRDESCLVYKFATFMHEIIAELLLSMNTLGGQSADQDKRSR